MMIVIQYFIMWLARDKDGELYLYDAYPKKQSEFFGNQFGYSSMLLDAKLYPEVTWENSPKKVELKLVEE